jgi:hypothetical protein
MASIKLSRRSVLRGAGSIAIALPFLEAMAPERAAAAAPAGVAKRFIAVYTPGGTVRERWVPTAAANGNEAEYATSSILKPLEAVRPYILIPDGLAMKAADGEQHQAGMVAFLSGSSQSKAANKYSPGPSIDQVLAGRVSTGKRMKSLELAMRWGTGKAHGLLSPISAINFEEVAPYAPIPPRLDPKQIWKDLFGALDPKRNPDAAALLTRKKSMIESGLTNTSRRFANSRRASPRRRASAT